MVVIYLSGLAGVAHMGIRYAREDRADAYRQFTEHAVELLADRLATLKPADEGALQRTVRQFASRTPVRELRVLDSRRIVLASICASEIGATLPPPTVGSLRPRRMEVIDLVDGAAAAGPAAARRLCAPILAEGADDEDARLLEVVTDADAAVSPDRAEYAGTLTIVLGACGALFVIYRRLRRQMRSVVRIARQLEARGDRIADELGALRVADSAGALGRQWNQLIDLTESLQAEVRRNKAAGELSQVFAKSSGGALAEAFHAVPSGVMHVGESGLIEYANAAARRLLGLPGQRADDEKLDALTRQGPAAALTDVILGARQDDGSFEPRNEIRKMEPDESAYRIRVLPLRPGASGASVDGALVLIDDVSQQIRADKAREDFVSQVTHELRTPLTNIRAYAETLSSGMFDDPKVITECYNVITKETRRLSRLIEDILNVSQMEVGSIQLHVDDVDLRALLTDSVRDVRGLAEEKNIDLRLTLPPKLEAVRADRDKLAVVINNLLGNALKYTPADGTVIVGCKVGGNEAVITVKDNGIGISPEDQARVFEKFQRSQDPQVQAQTGTGVGLYTAREVTRRHGGDIDLISEKGSGSTFIVRLPHTPSRAGAMSTAG